MLAFSCQFMISNFRKYGVVSKYKSKYFFVSVICISIGAIFSLFFFFIGPKYLTSVRLLLPFSVSSCPNWVLGEVGLI